MEKEQSFIEYLKTRRERVSSPRLHIYQALARKGALTTVALVDIMRKNGVDASTTYRTLTLFRRLSIIHDFVGGGRKLIELESNFAGKHHHHLWCMQCGRLVDFDDNELETGIRTAVSRQGFELRSHQLEVSGLCGRCTSKLTQ